MRLPDLYWADGRFQPSLEADCSSGLVSALASLRGQFSLVFQPTDSKVILARDGLGINKLFFAIESSSTVVVANYLIDLVNRNVPFEDIYSVPSGHFVEIDLDRRALCLRRYLNLETAGPREECPVAVAASAIRRQLELWFARLAMQFHDRRICVCLSGGLDSSVVAGFAAKYFRDVTAYTYGYADADEPDSEDVSHARRVAAFLNLPLRIVPASSEDALSALPDALCFGQDWREFNVHCAIVNEILARAIRADCEEAAAGSLSPKPSAAPGPLVSPLVLTGDLMNELLADYEPLSYAGREIYSLPKVRSDRLRTALVRGLDAGDREVGVFNHHGIAALQPYGLMFDHYLRLPASFISRKGSKQALVREMASDLVPTFLFSRRKVRAQIGDSDGPGGLVPTLFRNGRDSRWLRQAFCDRFKVPSEKSLDSFIRLGRYRFANAFPGGDRHQ